MGERISGADGDDGGGDDARRTRNRARGDRRNIVETHARSSGAFCPHAETHSSPAG